MAARRLFAVTITALAVATVLILASVMTPGQRRDTATGTPAPPSPSAPAGHSLMAVPIPADADCTACHTTGGREGLKDIPPMAHAVEGWRNCTACHADDRLVKTAPGHNEIGKDLCLACHAPPAAGASALPRPHHIVAGTSCITCHGSMTPLPSDMTGRGNCWICHPDRDSVGLFGGTPGPTASP